MNRTGIKSKGFSDEWINKMWYIYTMDCYSAT